MTLDLNRVTMPSGEVAYADEGDGPPVLLLHGFPTSSHLWRDVVPVLAPRFRAIAPDLLGYGASARPEDPEAVTIRAQARMARELLDHLGPEGDLAVVGHDIGGGVAQLLALEDGVRTLVLMDAISFDSWPIEAVRMIQGADPGQVDAGFVEGIVRLAFDMGMSRPERLGDGDREAFLEPWRHDPMDLIRAARGIDGVGLAGTEDRLARLEARTLVLWGEEDPYQPADLAERLGEVIPTATVALLPGCSHYVSEDAPEQTTQLVFHYLRTHHLDDRGAHDHGPAVVDLGVSFTRPEPTGDAEDE